MSDVKHTAGPWAVNEDGFRVESALEHGWVNDGWVICSTDGPDKKANAALIAAAPEMLEALIEARQLINEYTPYDTDNLDGLIAKASGETP